MIYIQATNLRIIVTVVTCVKTMTITIVRWFVLVECKDCLTIILERNSILPRSPTGTAMIL